MNATTTATTTTARPKCAECPNDRAPGRVPSDPAMAERCASCRQRVRAARGRGQAAPAPPPPTAIRATPPTRAPLVPTPPAPRHPVTVGLEDDLLTVIDRIVKWGALGGSREAVIRRLLADRLADHVLMLEADGR